MIEWRPGSRLPRHAGRETSRAEERNFRTVVDNYRPLLALHTSSRLIPAKTHNHSHPSAAEKPPSTQIDPMKGP